MRKNDYEELKKAREEIQNNLTMISNIQLAINQQKFNLVNSLLRIDQILTRINVEKEAANEPIKKDK